MENINSIKFQNHITSFCQHWAQDYKIFTAYHPAPVLTKAQTASHLQLAVIIFTWQVSLYGSSVRPNACLCDEKHLIVNQLNPNKASWLYIGI